MHTLGLIAHSVLRSCVVVCEDLIDKAAVVDAKDTLVS